MSQREASESYGIPRSTIGDKMRGTSEPTVMQRGVSQVLSKAVEDRLVYVLNRTNKYSPTSIIRTSRGLHKIVRVTESSKLGVNL